MIRMICMNHEEIADYLQGRIPEERSVEIESHLSSCSACDQTARELEASDDSLVRHLRLKPDPPLVDDDWQSCLAQLRSLPTQDESDTDAEEPVSLEQAIRPAALYHYRLGPRLGQGGMGVVYRSWHPQLHRPVAIKILSAARSTDAPSIARFQREMRAAGSLDHSGIVRAVDAGIWQGTYYLVMEFIDGVDLSRLVHLGGPVDVANACAIMVQAAEALHYAHQQQLLHRDIKPSNLMLTRDGRTKILDFGLARLEHGGLTSHDATTAGRLVGTLDYLAPEQAEGRHPIDARSDIYGLGATLFRLLAGRPPHGPSANRPILEYLQQITHQAPQSISQYRSDLPPDLCRIVDQLLAMDPAQRPASAMQVADLLRPFAEHADLVTLANDSIPDPDDTESFNELIEPTLAAERTTNGTSDPPAPAAGGRRTRIATLAASFLMAGALFGWAAVTLWLKTGEASVEIISEVDDIALEFVKDGRVAKTIEVHPGKDVSLIRVGKYELRIAGESDHVLIDQSSLTLMRGDQRVVRINQIVDAPSPANDEYADARTSKGRTYRQWTDIVLRETDPETVVDAVEALSVLTTAENQSETFETLIKIAGWNESRSSDPIAQYYISYLSNKPASAAPLRGGISSRSFGGRPSPPERDFGWERLYPPVDDQWRNVVDAILEAIKKLPEGIQGTPELTINSADETRKRIVLLDAIKHHRNEDPEYVRSLTEQLCQSDQPSPVQAIANHVWISELDRPAGDVQRRALSTDDQQLVKAVLASLLHEEKYPFGRVMGTAAGKILPKIDYGFGYMLNDLARRSINEGAAFTGSEEAKLLVATGDQLVADLDQRQDLAGPFQELQIVEMLTATGMLSDSAKAEASQTLHKFLERQLIARQAVKDPSQFDETTMWIMYVVQAIAAIDGSLPEELDRYAMDPQSNQAKPFQRWAEAFRAGDSEAERNLTVWLVQFPLETLQVIVDALPEVFRSQIESRELAARFRQSGRAFVVESRSLNNVSLNLLIPYAARKIDDDDTALTVGLKLQEQAQRGLEEIQLVAPLKNYAETLSKLAESNGIGTARGLVLRLAQIGGADPAPIRKLAMQRCLEQATKDDREWWVAPGNEFSWLVECLSYADPQTLSDEQVASINDRLMSSSFMSVGSGSDPLQRSLLALLRIGRRNGGADPRIVKLALGETVDGFRTPWRSMSRTYRPADRSSPDQRFWDQVARRAPAAVMEAALETVIDFPLADPEILETLQEINSTAAQMGGASGKPTRLLNQAILATEKALEGK